MRTFEFEGGVSELIETNTNIPSSGPRVAWGPLYPFDGYWHAGDIVINNSGVGDQYWYCVAEGSPGTWVAAASVETLFTGYDDVQGPISEAGGSASLTYEQYRDTGVSLFFMRHDQSDTLFFIYQMPHTWDRGYVFPHIHIIPMSAIGAPQKIRFTGKYAWSQVGVELPANAGWTPFVVDHIVDIDQQYKQAIVPLVACPPPAGALESNVLIVSLTRAGTDPNDTYSTNKVGGTGAANVCALSSDVHIFKNKFGTPTEVPD